MLDIPIGKALAAVELIKNQTSCEGCFLAPLAVNMECKFFCSDLSRKDGKNVIFKLVDLPGDEIMKKARTSNLGTSHDRIY